MRRFLIAVAVGLAASAFYLFAFPAATLFYECVVLLHILAGAAFLVFAVPWITRLMRSRSLWEKLGWSVLLLGGVCGAVIIFTGARRNMWPVLYIHEVVSIVGCAVLLFVWTGRQGWLRPLHGGALRESVRFTSCLALAAALVAGAWWVRTVPWQRANIVHNPSIAPASMDTEGAGPKSEFFPSAAETSTGKTVSEDYFVDSAACKQCHADIYREWESSAHHFSSFNNQWYRQAIVYMQSVDGVESSKWCAGCHDPALFFPGNFNTPIKNRIFTPAAQAGIGCMVCHSIRAVRSTMGNGSYTIEYPALFKLVDTKNPILHKVIDFLIEEDPEPHRRTFLKPFMKNNPADFCSTCHKVHLDVTVNHYRWVRGFDDYDNWQASGVSGFGARSFYYPPQPENCADCHMPMTPSDDAGNLHGFVHSHRFVAANTALPFVNKDKTQLDDTEHFLQDRKVSVDIFAISPETSASRIIQASATSPMQAETTFAVGEETERQVTGMTGETNVAPVTAPLDRVQGTVVPGETAQVDVVVRTLSVGHFFPGGTVDAFDCWLELKATDDNGKVLFWSGMAQDHGKGPVDPGAEFYRSLSIDAHGNAADKRNAWTARATVYVHLIPPGAADTVHYRLQIPKDVRGHIHLEARLNYRKFAWINTQFAFAGKFLSTGPNDVTPAYDDRRMVFTASTRDVSGKIKAIPNPPIVVMAQSTAELTVLRSGTPLPAAKAVTEKADWHRWNDYGIGLYLQGNLKAAETAFAYATQADSNNPDGWVNIGRVRLQEGNLAGATQVLDKALQLSPNLARAHYFHSRVLREEGKYPEAIAQLMLVTAQYPYDRVVRNDLGRVLFLERRYAQARDQFLKAIAIDPEDLEANYNLMLCYTGLGDDKQAAAYQERYMRFKANEAAQTLTGPYRAKHPFDNLERQPIHEHDSVSLAAANANNGLETNLVLPPSAQTPSPQSATPKMARLGGGAH
ncbi:MAG TPA: tetratricopeptide repeat protein [Acidobacteriaceae bacterium]|nr:tetratricopeptide repeat protein [Acidobacteriaceae bacterium]